MRFPPFLNLKGKKFTLVKQRQFQDVGVYSGNNSYLRLGNTQVITKEIAKHNKLMKLGFPLATITEQGKFGSWTYYIETSLGKYHLGEVFKQEINKFGKISVKTFSDFLNVSKIFARAQLQTATQKNYINKFVATIHLNILAKELPQQKQKLLKKFDRIAKKLAVFPYVLTHADFCPHNLFKNGVIDFEHQSLAPAGYDIVTNIITIDGFPTGGDYELIGGYRFTPNQLKQYLTAMDKIYFAHGLPKISRFQKEFAFCREVWLTARMHRFPKLQQFRYNRFIKNLGKI